MPLSSHTKPIWHHVCHRRLSLHTLGVFYLIPAHYTKENSFITGRSKSMSFAPRLACWHGRAATEWAGWQEEQTIQQHEGSSPEHDLPVSEYRTGRKLHMLVRLNAGVCGVDLITHAAWNSEVTLQDRQRLCSLSLPVCFTHTLEIGFMIRPSCWFENGSTSMCELTAKRTFISEQEGWPWLWMLTTVSARRGI